MAAGLRNLHGAPGIGHEVRVAPRVNVSLAPIDRSGRNLEDGHHGGGSEASRTARQDAGIARLGHERRQPPGLQFEPDVDQQIRPAQLHREERVGVHEVRILDAAGEALHGGSVSGHLARDRGQPLGGGDHARTGGGGGGEGADGGHDGDSKCGSHVGLL
jgi:hypothetical protein